jgi:hypothetical protein
MGYPSVTFYGCEGSYEHTTHLYMHANDDYLMRVRCGGRDWLTGAEFLMQSQFLAAVCRDVPNHFRERSGGLLTAMIETNDYDVLEISRKLNDSIVVGEAA